MPDELEGRLGISRDELARFCERHGIVRLAVFGSGLREDFGPESDLDVLVEFAPDRVPGWEYVRIADELSAMVGRRVDMLTFSGIRKAYRSRILSTARTIYAAA